MKPSDGEQRKMADTNREMIKMNFPKERKDVKPMFNMKEEKGMKNSRGQTAYPDR